MCGTILGIFLVLSIGQNLLNKPESVVFDAANDRYLISNCGDGKIIQLFTKEVNEGQDTPGVVMAEFNTDLSSIRGMHIMGDVLYVASDSGLVGFDLITAQEVMKVVIPESTFLNDVASDKDGFIYVSDSECFKIFKVDPFLQSYSIFVDTGVPKCNGLLYDEKNNRLITCTGKINAPIFEVSLVDGAVTMIIKSTISYLDGMAFDSKGRIYISSWLSNSVYRIDAEFSNPPVKVGSGYKGPADICYDHEANLIVVPNFKANKIAYIEIKEYSTVPE